MEAVRKWTGSSTKDFCLYALLKMHGISKEMDQGSTVDFCLYSLPKMYGISEGIDQELDRGLLLIFLIERRRLLLIFLSIRSV